MKKLLSVTFFTGLLTLCRMLAGFIVAKVVAVYTGPSGMALLGQMQSLVTMLNGIVTAPAGNAIVRYTAEHATSGIDACSVWWRASFRWCVIICLSLIPTGLIFSKYVSVWIFNDSDYQWLVCLMFIVLPLSAVSTFINSVINGFQNYKRFISLGALSILASTLVMLILILLGGIKGALIAAAIQSSLIGLILLLVCVNQPWLRVKYWVGSVDKNSINKIGGYMFMAIVSSISLPVALIAIRKIIISHVGWDAAGEWQAVWKISEVYLSVTTMALSIYFLPQLSKLNTWPDISKEINSTALIAIPIVAIMAVVIYSSRDIIISVLFTERFRGARDLFLIQLVGDVLKVTSWLYAYPMISRGAAKPFIVSEVSFSILFIVLSILFVPHFNVSGVNIAYAISYFIYLIFSLFFVRKVVFK